jgi:ATP-dependent exoDNAse (exonuclease V) alpha subunit
MIADLVNEKVNNPHKLNIDWHKYTNVDGFELTEEQSSLLSSVCEYDIAILAGKAGSGKTSSVKALVKLMEDNGLSYSLLAPTGAAALRLSNQTNRKASTIHRKCLKDGEINSDVIIIDEMSMVGLDVFVMMLNCVTNNKAKFVLCGDMYQLPSISKGCVFSDLIESHKVPTAELTKVFRYDTSGGAFVGENVRQGKNFFDSDRVKENGNVLLVSGNYKFVETDEIFDEIVLEYNHLRKKYKEDEIIILSPFNKGACGTYKINEYIENEYNAPKAGELSLSYKRDGVNIVFRKGSRVVNTKNDYKALPLESWNEINSSDGVLTEEDVPLTQLFNGQIGVVREVQEKYLVCQFDEELIVIQKPKLNTLLLARAISTHRSQGGEWKAVINVVSEMHSRLLSKQLLYVAVTRAKEFHCDIGNKKAFTESLLVDVIDKRNTWLKDLLKGEDNNENNETIN